MVNDAKIAFRNKCSKARRVGEYKNSRQKQSYQNRYESNKAGFKHGVSGIQKKSLSV